MINDPQDITVLREKMAELKKSDPTKYLELLQTLNGMLAEVADEIESITKKEQ